MFLSILLLCGIPICSAIPEPVGAFSTECHERHFRLSFKSSFLGDMMRFDIEDSTGVHFLSSQRAAECGYTLLLNHHGDVIFRASYLACYVENRGDSEFRLRVWFVTRPTDGRVQTFPFRLHCSLPLPWSPREIVCEENYMEVSIKQQIPVASDQGVKWMDMPPMEREELSKGHVVFHRPGHAPEAPRPVREVQSLGYHIVATETRILLRSAYSSPLSYTLKEREVEVEAVSAIILLQHQGVVITFDASVACSMNRAVVDGAQMLWTFPFILSPLVRGGFREGGMRMGVDGRLLRECVMRERGYGLGLRDGVVEVRIPFGAEGGHVKSRVIDGQYAQSLFVDLFHMHQWEDAFWPVTQHRTFRLLSTPYAPRTPTLTNNTVPSLEMFSVTLGVFAHDVSLQNVTVGSDSLSWIDAQKRGLHITKIPFSNGSHAYLLQAPFSHPLVSLTHIGGGHRRYTLALTFALYLWPSGEVYNYSGSVVCDLQDPVVPARLEGKCTERGVLVLLHYGSQQLQWELYVGSRRLDWELVELGDFTLDSGEDYFSVELPLYSPGMTYEELTLRGLVARVEVSMMDVETVRVEHTLVQRCTFPVRELLVCLPEGRMVVVADTTRSIPPTRPNSTTLLDPTCGPADTDSARALFSFALDSCGTTRTVEGEFLLYENQVTFAQDLIPTDGPLIHRDSPYRLTIQCRYPVNDTSMVALHHPGNSTPILPTWSQKRTRSSQWTRRRRRRRRAPFLRGGGTFTPAGVE